MNATASNVNWSRVPVDKRSAVEVLWNWDLGFVLERLLDKRLMPEGIIKQAITEYRKFMTLAILTDDLDMFSAEVDEVWHAHILFTRQYADFCQAIYGGFMHHEPASSSGPPSEHANDNREKFFRVYRELFGEPSVLWS